MDNLLSASKVSALQSHLGIEWPSINKAYTDSLAIRRELTQLFSKSGSPDTSVVVFGSIARLELTSKSDTDWILLVDGSATPEHKAQEAEVVRKLDKYIDHGKSGIFGKFVGSHDLVHKIGGEDDLNSNTTRRILLLLESFPIGHREAYDRVRRQILRRYLEDDRGLTHGGGTVRIPRFLLNDLTRYWRTITVDFVYKQVQDQDEKWALRNAKLRMSRKLVFASGLLRCFFCNLDPLAATARAALQSPVRDVSLLLKYVEDQLALSPLETVAKACLELEVTKETAVTVFGSYDKFLAILDNAEKPEELAKAQNHEDLRRSAVWNEIREVTEPFHRGLVNLFFVDDRALSELAIQYGVF